MCTGGEETGEEGGKGSNEKMEGGMEGGQVRRWLGRSDCVSTDILRCLLFFYSSSLKMAVLEIQGNGESSYVPQEAISSAIQLLEDPLQRVRIFRITPSSTDLQMSSGFSSFVSTGHMLLRSREHKTERTRKICKHFLRRCLPCFCIHTHRLRG